MEIVCRQTGAHAGVIIWPDILGLRPAFRQMGKRLAESGYSVLVVNPFYRQKRAPVVAVGASFIDLAVRNARVTLDSHRCEDRFRRQFLEALGCVIGARCSVELLNVAVVITDDEIVVDKR